MDSIYHSIIDTAPLIPQRLVKSYLAPYFKLYFPATLLEFKSKILVSCTQFFGWKGRLT